jgi:hypothetical protein
VIAAALLLACAAAPPAAPPPDLARARLVAALRAAVPLDPVGLAGDPYEAWRGRAPPRPAPGAVCAVRFEPDGVRYRLRGFASEGEARAAGWAPTHAGACGTCSTLQDLAVYLERPDLTTPVRRCGIRPTASGAVACLERLGFSPACARTWWFNARNTRRECLWVCVKSWVKGEPSAGPDGRLNPCLQCDEDRSGPVFKAAAGRTRRNSGIRSSIPRREDEVARVVHDYVPGVGAPAAQ